MQLHKSIYKQGQKLRGCTTREKNAEYFVRHSFAVTPAGFYYASFMIQHSRAADLVKNLEGLSL